jgi:hypothetical protein
MVNHHRTARCIIPAIKKICGISHCIADLMHIPRDAVLQANIDYRRPLEPIPGPFEIESDASFKIRM